MNEELKAFLEWIASAVAVSAAFTPFIMAIVQGLGKFLSGTYQLAGAVTVGLAFGLLGYFGLWGIPASFYEGLKLLLFLSMTTGIPIGTYEAIKHASGR